MLCAMSTPSPNDLDDKIIDIGPSKPKPRRKLVWTVVALIVVLLMLLRSASIYINALWFDSLGYSSVYWYTFRSKLFTFLIFTVLTIIILRGAFWLIERTVSAGALERRTIIVNNQAVNINPARLFRPVAWGVAIIGGLVLGLGMVENWREFALYLNQPGITEPDPIFNKPLGFYLFSLPVHQILNRWLILLSVVILIVTVLAAVLAHTQKQATKAATDVARKTSYAAVSV